MLSDHLRGVRLRVGQILTAPDYVIDVIDGPRKIAVRGDDGEIRRFATREEARAALDEMETEAQKAADPTPEGMRPAAMRASR